MQGAVWRSMGRRREDKLAGIILKDACFPSYLSLPGFVDIKRGVIF